MRREEEGVSPSYPYPHPTPTLPYTPQASQVPLASYTPTSLGPPLHPPPGWGRLESASPSPVQA